MGVERFVVEDVDVLVETIIINCDKTEPVYFTEPMKFKKLPELSISCRFIKHKKNPEFRTEVSFHVGSTKTVSDLTVQQVDVRHNAILDIFKSQFKNSWDYSTTNYELQNQYNTDINTYDDIISPYEVQKTFELIEQVIKYAFQNNV